MICAEILATGKPAILIEKLVVALSGGGISTAVDLNDHIFAYLDGMLGDAAFGGYSALRYFNSVEELQGAVHDLTDAINIFTLGDFFPNAAGKLMDVASGIQAQRLKIFKKIEVFLEKIIDLHLDPSEEPERHGNFVDVLIQMWKAGKSGSVEIRRKNIKAMTSGFYFAAITMESSTIIWAMTELMRNPRALAKAQEEVRRIVGIDKARVGHDILPKLKYLKMVIRETIRLHPPQSVIFPRETARYINVGGYDIPPRTRILINAWATSRDPDVWSADANEFNPDRFNITCSPDTGEVLSSSFEMLAFGGGRRRCPAMDFVLVTADFTLANLLHCFDWEMPIDAGGIAVVPDDEEDGQFVMGKKTHLFAVPIPRYTD